MSSCTFFGHRNCPLSILSSLKTTIVHLIERHHVDTFYVGNQGSFDRLVFRTLIQFKEKYTHISISVVLAYITQKTMIPSEYTLFPEGIEFVPKRIAIPWRNEWMIRNSEYVVAYLESGFGGTFNAVNYARKHHKTIIRIHESES